MCTWENEADKFNTKVSKIFDKTYTPKLEDKLTISLQYQLGVFDSFFRKWLFRLDKPKNTNKEGYLKAKTLHKFQQKLEKLESKLQQGIADLNPVPTTQDLFKPSDLVILKAGIDSYSKYNNHEVILPTSNQAELDSGIISLLNWMSKDSVLTSKQPVKTEDFKKSLNEHIQFCGALRTSQYRTKEAISRALPIYLRQV